jgi:hypothetical protein
MKRRNLVLGAHAAFAGCAWDRRLSAQTGRKLVGSCNAGSYAPNVPFVEAVSQGLAELGYIEGKTFEYEHLWADQRYERLPRLSWLTAKSTSS